MMSLADLQRQFCDALRSTERPPQALLDEFIDDGLDLQRFNVYRNNFIVLNADALADMYPVVKRLLGESAFQLLATRYVRQQPPTERTLLLYGQGFADYMASIAELSTLPYLPDMARLEYAWTAAYHAEEAGRLDQQALSGVSPEAFGRLQLITHPSMQCLASDYPIYRIWTVNQGDGQDQAVSLDEGASHLIVIRPDAEVDVRAVSAAEWQLLYRLQRGDTVEDAYLHAVEITGEFDLTAFFTRHLFDGTFCALVSD